MKKIKDKKLLVAADYSGFDLKEAVVSHLKSQGWEIEDIGIKSKDEQPREMFQRIGFKVGSKITEGEYERALVFCGTGMGIHLAANKCPGVRAGVVENVPSAIRAIEGNDINVLAMGGFYIAPQLGIDIADAYLNTEFGGGYHAWPLFNAFHKLAVDEINEFNYNEYKNNGYNIINPKVMDDYKDLINE